MKEKIDRVCVSVEVMMLYLSKAWLSIFAVLFIAQVVIAAESEANEEFTSLALRIDSEHFDSSEVWYGLFEGDITDRAALLAWHNNSNREQSIPLVGQHDDLTLVVYKRGSVPNIFRLNPELIDQGILIKFSNGGTVHGQVTSLDGEPILDSSLEIEYPKGLLFSPPDSSLLVWDIGKDGTFQIDGLPEGTNTLSAFAPGFMPASPTDIQIEPDSQSLEIGFRLSRAVYIVGQVVESDGSLAQGNVEASVDAELQQNLEKHFDHEGRFRIGPFAENTWVQLSAFSPDGRHSDPYTVRAQSDTNVDLTLVDHRTRLTATISNSKTGELIDEYTFWASKNNHPTWPIKEDNARGKLDARVDSVSFRFKLHAPGYEVWASDMFSIAGRPEFDLGMIELEPIYLVSGRIVDEITKKPIENATVMRTDGANYFARVFNLTTMDAKTDTNGEFTLQGFPSSGGAILASAKGYRSFNQIVTGVETLLEIELTPRNQSTIEGTVFSSEGMPMAGAEVILMYSQGAFGSGGGATAAQTDEDGRFKFVGKDDGTYTAYAYSDVGRSLKQNVNVDKGQSVSNVKLVIGTLGRIYGEVWGLTKDEGALVKADGLESNLDENFSYELVGVSDGQHRVSIVTNEGRRLWNSVDIDQGSEERVDFEFGESHTLTGVVAADGRPMVDVALRAVSVEDSSMVSAQARTRHDGSFSLRGLARGAYWIEVRTYGRFVKVEIDGDTVRDIDLGTHSLSGKVVAPGADSLFKASITLTGFVKGNLVRLYQVVDRSGSYSFDGLEAGKYSLTIEHEGYETLARQVRIASSKTDYDLQLVKASEKE